MANLQIIQSKIYEIRGQKVMLDFDLAELYGIETRVLKQAVRRNSARFEGEDFMFELTKEEISRSQIVILNKGRGSNIKYAPFAFTELGVAMRAFVAMRQLIHISPVDNIGELKNELKELKEYIEDVFTDQNDINEDTRMQLELINQTLAELQTKDRGFKERKRIGYKLPGCEEEEKK